jgi:hypothetical protein
MTESKITGMVELNLNDKNYMIMTDNYMTQLGKMIARLWPNNTDMWLHKKAKANIFLGHHIQLDLKME